LHDTINGGLGDDYLSGSASNDIIIAGIGKDTLSGGLGYTAFFIAIEGGETLPLLGCKNVIS
jgi:Ca2+-binding RTX toxin-like protein